MFTVCPKCTLTLVVTTVDLRAGQGYVRCGRCANVFNALIALREGDPSSSTDPANQRLQETQPASSSTPAYGSGVAMEPEPEPEPEPVAVEAESEEASLEFDAEATDVSEIFVSPTEAEHDAASGSYEEVVLADGEGAYEVTEHPADELPTQDRAAASEWSLLDDEPVADAESMIEESPFAEQAMDEGVAEPANPAYAAEVHEADEAQSQDAETPAADPEWVEQMFAEAEVEAERIRTAEREALKQRLPEGAAAATALLGARAAKPATAAPDAASEALIEPLLAAAVAARPRWQYVAGIAGLCVVLVAQILHFNRQSLVLSPTWGPALSQVYGWFGATLTPRWDLTAYTVKQLGADAEGGEGSRLRVRLSLQNESERVQPLPLLRLTLQDRYGNAVATRDLEPRDYLPPRAADQRLLEPDQRIDAELHVIDPGRAASSFEIDACLRAEGGAIGCANDARRRAAG